jgi:hypothetical protein
VVTDRAYYVAGITEDMLEIAFGTETRYDAISGGSVIDFSTEEEYTDLWNKYTIYV